MKIKKILLHFKNGFLTPLESDTLLGYVFAKGFSSLTSVFHLFQQGTPPFLISNGYGEGTIVKPLFFGKQTTNERTTLWEDLDGEKNKKLLKSQTTMPIQKDLLEGLKIGNTDKDFQKRIFLKNDLQKVVEFKNAIPRFGTQDAEPYPISDVCYATLPLVMYVKIFDEEAFNLFWMVMKEVLETIGRGKAISRGYGKLHQVKVVELNEEEQSVFAYLNTLKQQGILVVLNNFKPSEQEIKMIDLEHSFLSFTNKNTKSLGKHIFKGNMTFIAPGSVLQKKANTPDFVGSYYQVNQSFNFGYLF